MPTVIALYRYPLKGFTPEPVRSLGVLPGGRVAGDRVFNLRFADAPVADLQWCRKYHGVVMANTPGLARLQVAFDAAARRLVVRLAERTLVAECVDGDGRQRIAQAICDYVQSLDENPLSGHPSRLPIRLVGDGVRPLYQDNEAGQVTLHARESLASVGQALGDGAHDERRYRHNVVIEGAAAWEEQTWVGGGLRIGSVAFETIVPKTRCLATHANPQTGVRDLQVMELLRARFGQVQPTFGVGMLSTTGGEIRLGDEVRVL